MFEQGLAGAGAGVVGAGRVRDWVDELATVDGRGTDGGTDSRGTDGQGTDGQALDVERIETIRALEELKSAAAAAQARLTAAFAASQRAEQRRDGVRESEVARGIGAAVALARRESPHRGSRLVGLAEALVHEMPRTMAALTAGETNEWRATVVARETACLPRELREQADLELGDRLECLGDARPSPRRASSPTGSTPPPSSTAAAAPRRTAGSPSARRRTPCPASAPTCRSRKESPRTPRSARGRPAAGARRPARSRAADGRPARRARHRPGLGHRRARRGPARHDRRVAARGGPGRVGGPGRPRRAGRAPRTRPGARVLGS